MESLNNILETDSKIRIKYCQRVILILTKQASQLDQALNNEHSDSEISGIGIAQEKISQILKELHMLNDVTLHDKRHCFLRGKWHSLDSLLYQNN